MNATARRPAPKPWLPLYLLVVVAATLSPGAIVCGSGSLGWEPHAVDVVANVALFVPLGIALAGRGALLVLVSALALSGCIEVAQLFLPRVASAADLLANALGALLGLLLAPRLPRPALRLSAPLGAAALLAAALAIGVVAWLRPGIAPNDLSNWEPFPLLIGDEADGGRPWRGSIAELRVYDRALPAATRIDGEAPPWSRGGPVLWLRFEQPRRARLDGPGGPRALGLEPPPGTSLEPDGLRVRGGGWRLPDAAAEHLLERLGSTHAFSVAARLQPDGLHLAGPARILSFSADSSNRNFTLGQQHAEVVLRVSTPHTGANGTGPPVTTRDAPLDGGPQSVLATFSGLRARIEVDGRCATETLYLEALGPPPLGAELAASVVAVTALAGIGAAAWVGGSRRRRATALAAGSGLAWAALLAAGAGSPLPGFAALSIGLCAATALAAAPLMVREG